MRQTALTITRGDDVTLTVTVTDAGQVVDLSGAFLRFTAKRSTGDPDGDAIIAKDSDAGISLLNDGSDGKATVEIDGEDTDDLEATETLTWDLQVTAGGRTRTAARGLLTVTADVSVTRP